MKGEKGEKLKENMRKAKEEHVGGEECKGENR